MLPLHMQPLLFFLFSVVWGFQKQKIKTTIRSIQELSASAAEPWYSEGLSFSCTSCGKCCSGSSGSVRVTKEEAEAISEFKGLTLPEFLSTYTRRRSLHTEFKEVKTKTTGYDCIFLDRESQPGFALCSIYKLRPLQCKTWPFWPELLRDEESWLEAASSPFHHQDATDKKNRKTFDDGCPGINRGDETIPLVDIQQQLEDTIKWRVETRDESF